MPNDLIGDRREYLLGIAFAASIADFLRGKRGAVSHDGLVRACAEQPGCGEGKLVAGFQIELVVEIARLGIA